MTDDISIDTSGDSRPRQVAEAGHDTSSRLAAEPDVTNLSGLRPRSFGTLLMAVISGLCVANMYYLQPILPRMAAELGVSPDSLLPDVSATQIGYALGLLMLVPLGDIRRRKNLVRVLLATTMVLLVALPFTTGPLLTAAFGLLGFTTCSGQVIMPWAADLAVPHMRARVVGAVMTGLILGTLLCRAVAGLVVELANWQAVYWGAAAVTALCLVASGRLPHSTTRPAVLSYRQLMQSIPAVARQTPKIIQRAVTGALAFAGFSVFWTTLPLHLSVAPFDYPADVIGLFGFLGAAGALGATVAGRLGDRGLRLAASLAGLGLVALSFGGQLVFPAALAAVLVGAVTLDFGVQLANVSNQSAAISLAPELRSRLNTVYMVIYFLGGAMGSGLAGVLWPRVGWPGTCAAGVVLAVLGVGTVLVRRRDTAVRSAVEVGAA
jgi:predicted MFS family arabinose efflux permease